ncbi:hypothetical protein BGZ76_002207 [Entomortierella beljakovae]|nr:hypothetical protein BGZ76_002207 [Entomortierella beljakovae]
MKFTFAFAFEKHYDHKPPQILVTTPSPGKGKISTKDIESKKKKGFVTVRLELYKVIGFALNDGLTEYLSTHNYSLQKVDEGLYKVVSLFLEQSGSLIQGQSLKMYSL